jgi:hypothetical protein
MAKWLAKSSTSRVRQQVETSPLPPAPIQPPHLATSLNTPQIIYMLAQQPQPMFLPAPYPPIPPYPSYQPHPSVYYPQHYMKPGLANCVICCRARGWGFPNENMVLQIRGVSMYAVLLISCPVLF